jgi:hypothetical protein
LLHWRALALHSADGVTEEIFSNEQIVYRIGVPPVRVDILTSISGCVFQGAWGRRVAGVTYGVPVHFISLPDPPVSAIAGIPTPAPPKRAIQAIEVTG